VGYRLAYSIFIKNEVILLKIADRSRSLLLLDEGVKNDQVYGELQLASGRFFFGFLSAGDAKYEQDNQE
jgi:hypothetical protein